MHKCTSLSKQKVYKPRMDAWQAFVRNTIDYGRAQNQTMTVGVMQQTELDFLAKKGIETSPVMFVRDNLIAGKKAKRHANEGDALDVADWLNLPNDLPNTQVYWDRDSQHLVYVSKNKTIVAVRNGKQNKNDDGSQVATAYTLKKEVLERDINTGRFTKIR